MLLLDTGLVVVTTVAVFLVVSFAVNVLERVGAWLSFLYFKPREIGFRFFFTVLCHLSIVFSVVQFIAFNIFRSMKSAYES